MNASVDSTVMMTVELVEFIYLVGLLQDCNYSIAVIHYIYYSLAQSNDGSKRISYFNEDIEWIPVLIVQWW